MLRYRIDFIFAESGQTAPHEIDYDSDQAAIASAHAMNGFPTIGSGFQVWRDDRLVYYHRNEPLKLSA